MYRKPVIAPPWGGWNDSSPALSLPNNSFKQIQNWFVNKQRLQTFPKLPDFLLPNDVVYTMRSFLDLQSIYHTVLFGQQKAHYYQPGPLYNVINPGAWVPITVLPYATEVFQSRLFFSNGFDTRYVKGDANWYAAGDCITGAKFMGRLANHLILANLYEHNYSFPLSMRWSASGNPLVWDVSIDYTAGSALLDVEDPITGWATINNVGYVFHRYGISSVTPTGVGGDPFFIENFSLGKSGIGCYYPYTLATYGTFCVFVALNDVYYFDGGGPQAIGGNSKKSIFADLNAASSQVTSEFIGTMNNGVDYVSYWLCIPINNDTQTAIWVYTFDSQSWQRLLLPYGALRCMANLVMS